MLPAINELSIASSLPMLKKGNSNESFLDLDLESTRTRDPIARMSKPHMKSSATFSHHLLEL
jgi:hypothetical protein